MVRETPKFHEMPVDVPGALQDARQRASSLRTIISDRFKRLSGFDITVQTVEFDRDGDTPPPVYCADRPDCARWCKGLWSQEVDHLRKQANAFWLTTVCGRYCAFVPVSDNGSHVTAIRIACVSDVPEELWIGNLEYVTLLAHRLDQAISTPSAGSYAEPGEHAAGGSVDACHPLVSKARLLIERKLADCELTVAGVADVLNVNATYLSHVFATETGQRMSRYINQRRIEKAQHLLMTTDWSIKRIGYECGFANASWFGQRFRDHAKMTPGEYRRRTLPV